MAAGILSRMEGKMGIRAWRWYVCSLYCSSPYTKHISRPFLRDLFRLFYIEVSAHKNRFSTLR